MPKIRSELDLTDGYPASFLSPTQDPPSRPVGLDDRIGKSGVVIHEDVH